MATSGNEASPGQDELRQRLAEAEETLRAIREGEVDALVMRGHADDEVLPLGGHDGYRAFMEAMDIGAAAIDAESKVIYANASLAALLGATDAALQGDGLFALLGEQPRRTIERLIADPHADPSRRSVIVDRDGERRHLEVSVGPLSLGFGEGFALTFTDVTERIETAAAHETDRIGRAIMSSSNEAVLVCLADGTITHANAGVREFCQGSCAGRIFDEVFSLDFPLNSGLINGADLIGVASSGTTVRGVEAVLDQPEGPKEVVLNAAPLRRSNERIYGCIVTVADVTERRLNEKRQALLMQELAHRVRNTLTLVMSIANRTIAGTDGIEAFRRTFGQRLQALSVTHQLLAEGAWTALTVEELVTVEMEPYVGPTSDRVALHTCDYRVTPDTAVALGLIFHELVTNAVKYGALSDERGKVTVTCVQSDAFTEIRWEERGGPPVQPPAKQGFGQTLISKGLGRAGGRTTEVEFHPDGVICRMFLRNDQLASGHA